MAYLFFGGRQNALVSKASNLCHRNHGIPIIGEADWAPEIGLGKPISPGVTGNRNTRLSSGDYSWLGRYVSPGNLAHTAAAKQAPSGTGHSRATRYKGNNTVLIAKIRDEDTPSSFCPPVTRHCSLPGDVKLPGDPGNEGLASATLLHH